MGEDWMSGKKLLAGMLAGVFAVSAFAADNDLDVLRGLVLNHAKVPLYNKKTLQLMAFCDKAERQGKLVVGSNTLLDLIRRDADVDAIKDGWGVKFYDLGAALSGVVDFWKERLYSEGVMFTSRADIDQELRQAFGDAPVFFRSPVLDLDGIGFEADFNKRTVMVREDVRIVVRTGSSDPRRIFAPGSKLPEKYEFITASGDSMLIDLAGNQVVLIGNVKVGEERSTIDCDRMTIFLERKDDETLRKENAAGPVAAEDTLEGVSRILCDGSVVVRRRLPPGEQRNADEQKALADHLVYDVLQGTVTLTGERRMPIVIHGKESLAGRKIVLYRDAQRAVVTGDCRVVAAQSSEGPDGKPQLMTVYSDRANFDYRKNYAEFLDRVRVDDPRMELRCRRMYITLREIPGTDARSQAEQADATLTGMPDFQAGAARELDQIQCSGDVTVVRKGTDGKLLPNERASSSEARFDYEERKITLTGGSPTLTRGTETMSGRELVIWINEERLSAVADSRLTLCSAPVKGQAAEQTVITSDSSDLNYGGSKLIFTGNVKVRDPRMQLDCDQMEILLREPAVGGRSVRESTAKVLGDSAGLGGENSKTKVVEQVICTGRVHAIDPRVDLKTDKLVLNFEQLPPGVPAQPGMFQSDGTMLVSALCEGNLVMVNQPDPGQESAAASRSDNPLSGMLGNSKGARTLTAARGRVDFKEHRSEFHDKVVVTDDQGKLKCEDLYLFASPSVPAAAGAQNTPAPEPGIDDDPFAQTAPVSTVPARIGLSDGLELSRILCERNVELSRRTKEGELQQAFGERADYVVADRKVVMTGTPDNPPKMHASGSTMRGDRVIVFMENEQMKVEGNTRLDIGNIGNFPGN